MSNRASITHTVFLGGGGNFFFQDHSDDGPSSVLHVATPTVQREQYDPQ